jgi:glycosyltransferase involved in cell wall biosynthesis
MRTLASLAAVIRGAPPSGSDDQRRVTVCVASVNTRLYTELCLRSMWRLAGRPFELVVGDCASTDGSVEMLRRLAAQQRLTLQEGPTGRRHGQWIDQWRRDCTADVIVVVDSDIEVLGPGWLPDLLRGLSDQVVMVAHDRVAAFDYTEPKGDLAGHTYRFEARPHPCVLALDHSRTAQITTTFMWRPIGGEWPPATAYDTAGAFAAALEADGQAWEPMPAEQRATFLHYDGRSRSRAEGARGGLAARAKLGCKVVGLRVLDRLIPCCWSRLAAE